MHCTFSVSRVIALSELVFVGFGLHDEMGISLRGLQEVKTADYVFMELYTSLMSNFSIKKFQQISGRTPQMVSRKELEDEDGKTVFEATRKGRVVLLVPGDPLIATTHVALRIRAERIGVRTRIVHGTSIASAVMGLSGLHNYKFGKSVTVPFPNETSFETPYQVVAQNKRFGLHTLCLLDIRVHENRFMKIREGLESLLEMERRRREKIVTMDTLVVGVSRAGSIDVVVKAGFLKDLLGYDFGGPPHSMIFPGKLHFLEAEALSVLAGAPENSLETLE